MEPGEKVDESPAADSRVLKNVNTRRDLKGVAIPLFLYGILPLLAVAYPIILQVSPSNFLASTYGKSYRQFEFFGFSMSCWLLVITYWRLRRAEVSSWKEVLPPLLFLVVALHFLVLFVEKSQKSWDFERYFEAAMAVQTGKELYGHTWYLYPPLLAQALAGLYGFADGLGKLTGIGVQPVQWDVAFYLYQSIQYLLLIAAYNLCCRFARITGWKPHTASILISILFVLNVPLLRTIFFNQVNLLLLVLILLGFLLVKKSPATAGFCIALAIHVKVYPVLVLVPWMLLRCYRAVLWTVIGFVGIFLLQTNFGRSPELWIQFSNFFPYFPAGTAFRDNSLHSFILNSLALSGLVSVKSPFFYPLVLTLVCISYITILIWFFDRFRKRERGYQANRDADAAAVERLRFYDYCIDSLALMLLLSPLVWDHHYVLATPFIIWAFLRASGPELWKICVTGLVIFGLPVFDIYPFSYHRLAGLLLLISQTSKINPHYGQSAATVASGGK